LVFGGSGAPKELGRSQKKVKTPPKWYTQKKTKKTRRHQKKKKNKR